MIKIIENPKLLRRYCRLVDKVFQCKEAFSCNVACPLALLLWTQKLMSENNMKLANAFRKALYSPIPKEEGRKIVRDFLRDEIEGKKEFPPPNWKDKLREIEEENE